MLNLQWILLSDRTTEVGGEVLAIGYQDEVLIGYLIKTIDGWICDDGNCELEECRAYIPTKDIIKSYPL